MAYGKLEVTFRKAKTYGEFRFLSIARYAFGLPNADFASRLVEGTPFPQTPSAMEGQKNYGGVYIEQTKRKRPFAYTFRATAEEKELIDSKLQASGLTMTEFIIRSIMGKPVVVIDGGNEMLAELKRQGNNLNQAIRNYYFYPDEKGKVLSAVADCKAAYRALLSAIGGS